jgi:hypothetical protein
MAKLLKVDHVTYAVKPENMRKWAWFYIGLLGGKLTLRTDDTNPGEKSSMMLWCIDFGEFGVALVAGIDREEKSHVTAFVEKHGDHATQHVAFQVPDLESFRNTMASNGLRLLGDILVRHDGFGYIKQVFAKGYHAEANPAEVGFPEFVQRPQKKGEKFPEVSFSSKVGTNLYHQAQQAMEEDTREAMLDFSRMPEDWEPPEPVKAAA